MSSLINLFLECERTSTSRPRHAQTHTSIQVYTLAYTHIHTHMKCIENRTNTHSKRRTASWRSIPPTKINLLSGGISYPSCGPHHVSQFPWVTKGHPPFLVLWTLTTVQCICMDTRQSCRLTLTKQEFSGKDHRLEEKHKKENEVGECTEDLASASAVHHGLLSFKTKWTPKEK